MTNKQDYKKALNEIKEDITLGIKLSDEDFKDTYNDLLELVEKEKPKKPIKTTDNRRNHKLKHKCPNQNCNKEIFQVLMQTNKGQVLFNNCPYCGQKLNWSEENE